MDFQSGTYLFPLIISFDNGPAIFVIIVFVMLSEAVICCVLPISSITKQRLSSVSYLKKLDMEYMEVFFCHRNLTKLLFSRIYFACSCLSHNTVIGTQV